MSKRNSNSFQPFQYMTYNVRNEMEDYSGSFDTKEEAKQWYYEHGIWLENQFNRTLILIEKTKKQLNLFNYE